MGDGLQAWGKGHRLHHEGRRQTEGRSRAELHTVDAGAAVNWSPCWSEGLGVLSEV